MKNIDIPAFTSKIHTDRNSDLRSHLTAAPFVRLAHNLAQHTQHTPPQLCPIPLEALEELGPRVGAALLFANIT